jgi:hypothetical protein
MAVFSVTCLLTSILNSSDQISDIGFIDFSVRGKMMDSLHASFKIQNRKKRRVKSAIPFIHGYHNADQRPILRVGLCDADDAFPLPAAFGILDATVLRGR